MQPTSQKILATNQARDLINGWRAKGEKIVFTNGCFDVLHLGHVDYLEKARGLGSRLVVGVNSDASVRTLKGSERPLYGEGARMRMIAALEFVDAVVKFEEQTPLELIRLLLPDILVKGSDYKISNIVGADIVLERGGRVELIDLLGGYSTTSLIERIKDFKQR